MAEVVHGALVLILWGSFARQLLIVGWRPRTIDQRSSCAAIGLFAAAMTLLFPPFYVLFDRAVDVPNAARLLGNSLGMCSGWAISPVRVRALHQGDRPGPLGSGWMLILLIGVEAALFAAARTDESIPGNFAEHYAGSDAIIAYRMILMAYVGSVMAQLFWVGWKLRTIARTIRQGYLRRHSQLQTLGWGCGTAYSIHEVIFPLLERFNLALPGSAHTLIQYTLLSGFVLLLLGSGFISFGHWVDLYVAQRVLYPLWRDLRSVVPSMVNNSAYTPADSGLQDARAVTELEKRIFGRLTELQDGLLALRPYATSPLVQEVMRLCEEAGLSAAETEATSDAALVATAVHRPEQGQVSGATGPYGTRGSADFDSELWHFLRVAHAYRRSPIIRLCLRRAAHEHPTATAPTTGQPRS